MADLINYVDALLKISDTQDQIKLTVLFDFLITKNYKLMLRFVSSYDFWGGGVA